MSKRATEDQEWERHKQEIHRLYMSDNKTLDQVMTLMGAQGFTRSKPQYERVLKKWGLRKNLSATEWRSVGRRIQKRHAQGKQSDVWIHGAVVDRTLVRQRTARHDNQPIFEQHRDRYVQMRSPVLPATITIRTPSPVPMEVVVRMPPPAGHFDSFKQSSRQELATSVIIRCSEPGPQVTFDHDRLAGCGDATPWHDFTTFLQSLDGIIPGHLLAIPTMFDQVNSFSSALDLPEDVEVLPLERYSALQAWLDDLHGALYLRLEDFHNDMADVRTLSTFLNAPRAAIPPTIHEWSQVNLKLASSLAHRDPQLEFLKLAVLLISNNAHVPQLRRALVELAHIQRNRLLLQGLLNQGLWSVIAFAEKLIPVVAEAGDLPLLKVLHQGGADLNARYRWYDSTALLEAIGAGHEHVVKYLLENGVQWCECSDTPKKDFMALEAGTAPRRMDPLDYAIWIGKVAIVKLLFSTRFNIGDAATLYIAVRCKRYEILEYLLQERPDLKSEFVQHPCILGSAAISTGDIEILHALIRHGLDIKSALECGCGDVVTEAVCGCKEDLLLELIHLGFNPASPQSNTICWAITEGREDDCSPFPFRSDYYGLSALHVSILNGSEHLSEILIAHGADVNQVCCGVTPLQVGVSCENEKMVRLLIASGASIYSGCGFDIASAYGWKPRYQTRRYHRLEHMRTIEKLRDYTSNQDHKILTTNSHRLHRSRMPPLQIAMYAGNEVLFRFLLANGAKVSESGRWNAWENAFRGRSEYIIEHMANANLVNLKTDDTLASCIWNNGTNLARRLISHGIFDPDIDFQDKGPLSEAIKCNDIQFVDFILSKIHKCNMQSVGLAGMITAIQHDRVDVVKRLHSIGIGSLQLESCGGYTSLEKLLFLYYRGLHGPSLKILLMLFDALVNQNPLSEKEDKIKTTALIHVLHQGALKDMFIVKLALGAGVDINSVSAKSPAPAMQLATHWDNITVASYLIANGAEVDSPALLSLWPRVVHSCGTPLQETARSSRYSLCEELLKRGAEVNAPPWHGGATAIQFAAMNGNFEMLALLLSYGADVNAAPAPDYGRYAIEGAAEYGRLDMVRFLIACRANIRGKTNIMYRRTIYRAWKEGHRALARMIQDFKAREYGPDDVEDVEVIMSSMSEDDLKYTSKREKDAYKRSMALHDRNLGKRHPEPYRQPVYLRWGDFMNGASADDVDAIIF